MAIAESQLRDYQARLGKPFQHDAYLTELTSLRDQLKAGLSATAHRSDDEKGPDASELAKKIKAIKAANTIEATPQRVRQKHSSAEEPVTARIRRRHETSPEPDQAVEKDASSDMPATPTRDSAGQPPKSFHQRVTQSRRDDDDSNLPPH